MISARTWWLPCWKEGCGFRVINIGIDVSCDKFVEEVKKNKADILCMSALLTTTMTYMQEVINALEAAGIRHQVKVMIGGAPVSPGICQVNRCGRV